MAVEQKIMVTVHIVVMHPHIGIRKQALVTKGPKHLMILGLNDNNNATVAIDPVMDGANEIELVFRPHPTLMEKDDSAQTRYIKTSGNATVDHLFKYLAVRLALEELRSKGESNQMNLDTVSEKQYTIYIATRSRSLITGGKKEKIKDGIRFSQLDQDGAVLASTRRRPLPFRRGPPRVVHVLVLRLRLLPHSLLPALPEAPAKLASPPSLMNIERPLLYFPSSIAEAEARHIVRWRRRLRGLIPESPSGRGQRSPGLGSLHSELMCPICLDMLKNTMTTKECLHRFCADCIVTALRSDNKECPTCRKKLVSKRSLRPDPNFDALISKIYPSRDEYEAHQKRVLARINKHNNQQALSHSIEEGLKIQAMNRLQRGKKQQIENGSGAEDNGDSSHCSNASTHSNQEAGPSNKGTKTCDDSGLELDNNNATVAIDPVMDGASEIELVFRPHPTLMEKDDSAQTRYIKT
ncbi:Hypothetical predicted protein [Marmota monax]|uniref:E3 ubiquitin-protein ligase RING2 n=1 Tax=Marmota monax TaxID=9995 RepID=A0A5E4C811_MARMO|nr:Hypothetical predicted protein [Marmota monax]